MSEGFTVARYFAIKFYNSIQWKRTRKAFIAAYFGICQRCGKANSKQVHHKIYLNPNNINDPDISLNFKNLELLCDTCHAKEHSDKYSPTAEGLQFDENGYVIRKTKKTEK